MNFLPLCLLLAPTPQDAPAPEASPEAPKEPPPYLRLLEDDGGLRLEIASRRYRFTREEAADTEVSLVGVMHVGDQGYYDALQEHLDAHEVVLFEQVVEADPDAHLTQASPADRARVAATHRRLATLLGAARRYATDVGQQPKDAAALVTSVQDERVRARLARASRDGWDRPISLVHPEVGDDLLAVSLGADGAVGGEGLDADLELRLSAAPPFEAQGIQKTLSDALGLVFQLEGMDYGSERWRRCDVTLSELATLLDESGAEAGALLSMLQGGSALETFASGMLKMMGSFRSGRGMLKLVSLEALARADEVMKMEAETFGGLFEVLLDRRNDVVLEALTTMLEEEPEVASIAVFYGAGHMADLDARLTRELGLEAADEAWFAGVDLRFADTGMSAAMVSSLRRSISRQLDRQLDRSR